MRGGNTWIINFSDVFSFVNIPTGFWICCKLFLLDCFTSQQKVLWRALDFDSKTPLDSTPKCHDTWKVSLHALETQKLFQCQIKISNLKIPPLKKSTIFIEEHYSWKTPDTKCQNDTSKFAGIENIFLYKIKLHRNYQIDSWCLRDNFFIYFFFWKNKLNKIIVCEHKEFIGQNRLSCGDDDDQMKYKNERNWMAWGVFRGSSNPLFWFKFPYVSWRNFQAPAPSQTSQAPSNKKI
jgi:hypothetical protein